MLRGQGIPINFKATRGLGHDLELTGPKRRGITREFVLTGQNNAKEERISQRRRGTDELDIKETVVAHGIGRHVQNGAVVRGIE